MNFRCGVSKINITPPVGIALAGMGKGNFAKGIHDDLYAKTIIFNDGEKTVSITACDLIGIDKEITEKVKEIIRNKQIEISGENVLIAAFHTHYGPSTRFILRYPEVNSFYIEELCEKIVFSISTALNNLKKAKIGMGKGFLKENLNRRKIFPDGSCHFYYEEPNLIEYFDGPCDNEVGVIYVIDEDSKPIGILINYTCHPICLPVNNTFISADYPGVATKIIEDEIGGIAIFTNGACGNIGPINGLKGFERMEEVGKNLACEVIKVIKKIKFNNEVKLEMSNLKIKLPIRQDIVDKLDMHDRFKGKKFIETEIKIVVLNECVFIGIPGEPFVELALELKEKSPFEYTYVFYLTNDDLLYIPHPKAYEEGGYEVSVAIIDRDGYNKILNSTLEEIKKIYEKIQL